MTLFQRQGALWFSSLLPFIFMGCETDHHDYIYNLKVSTTQPVHVSYQINDEDSTHYMTLVKGDSIRLCKRSGVSGDDIWDVETSASIYKIKSLLAYTMDSSSMTENLNRRGYWSAKPVAKGDSAYYTMELTDQCFILSKQNDFTYKASSSTQDSVVITCFLNSEVKKDTLFGGKNSATIGSSDIYIYNGNAKKEEKEKRLQLLSGLSSISLKLKKEGKDYTRSINLTREDSLFSFSTNECTLNIKETIFNTTNPINKR